jgi:oligoendopeptidase F
MFSDAVEITNGDHTWWSYSPHFIGSPGYVYAYAYGQLLALAIYARYEQEGDEFVPAYLDMLRAGGSKSPEEVTKIVGIDITDPGFWSAGLALIEDQIEEAGEAAVTSGMVSGK